MTESKETIRALSLLSGGLDSQLAICVLREQGIDVEGITFESPFFSPANAQKAAEALGVPLNIVDFTAEILGLLARNRHGFGSEMNPCIDCHTLMIKKAGVIMKEKGFHFLSTGEVLSQRPMSQNRQSLEVVAEESGCRDFLVRPLSAKMLPETEPEKKGWVDRSRLLAIEGRNRKAQFKLAKHYGLKNIPQPAGGCKLTEPNFCKRLRNLMSNEGLDVRAIRLLRVGRHFRLGDNARVIVGRDQVENDLLEKIAQPGEILVQPELIPGPSCLISSGVSQEQVLVAAGICARYCDLEGESPVKVKIISSGSQRLLAVNPETHKEIERMRI